MVLVKNWQFFHLFNMGKIAQQNAVFDRILKRTKACPDHKNNKLNSRKSGIFPKVLVKNWQFFHLFIIGEIGQEKCV